MTEPIRMRPGLSMRDRKKLRQQILDGYLARAKRDAAGSHLTMRCRQATQNGWGPEYHAGCRGEERGNGGCLCTCHDASAGAAVVSKRDEQP